MEGVQIMKFGYIKLISLQAKTSSSGPAFTLLINGTVNRKNIQMDIDLVPCFVFQESKWPTGGYRQNIVQNKVGVNCTFPYPTILHAFAFRRKPSSLYQRAQD